MRASPTVPTLCPSRPPPCEINTLFCNKFCNSKVDGQDLSTALLLFNEYDAYFSAPSDGTSVCLVGTDKAIEGVPTTFVALDSCSHHHLTPSKMLCEVLGKIEKPSVASLGGVNANNPAEVIGAVRNACVYLPTESGGVAQAVLDEILYVPNAPCTIFGQAKMWEHNGWRVRAEDTMRVELPGGEHLRMWVQHKSCPWCRSMRVGETTRTPTTPA